MKIRIGYDLAFTSSTPTPTILMLSVHPSRLKDLSEPHRIAFDPPIPSQTYTDHFGNICTRIVMPPGTLAVASRNEGLRQRSAGCCGARRRTDRSREFAR